MARYIDIEGYRKIFDEEYKKTRQLISEGETHLDNLAEGFSEAGRVIDKMPTADVAPKSEVDKWYHEYHAIKDELKQEKMYHRETEKLADKYFNELQTAKSEVAREIFEEIDKLHIHVSSPYDANRYAELKKKYTGDQT